MDGVRTVGPFENSGPWPPIPSQETTYTIRLQSSNTVNSVADAVATMSLPSYVRFTGFTNPADNSISYNNDTRQVSWQIGALSPSSSKVAAFQVAFLPSTTQRGTSPALVSEARVSGFDRYAQQAVQNTAPLINIQISNDPAYQNQYGSVERQ